MTAPAWLAQAYLEAVSRTVRHGFGESVAAAARYDYASAAREAGRAARWGLAASALGWLVQALGGLPRRHRYPSRAKRVEAKRARTQSAMRRNAWLSRGGDA